MERTELIEAATAAHRERGVDGAIRSHPAWNDLSDADRREVFERTARDRVVESALDARGLSTTGREVLRRIQAGA